MISSKALGLARTKGEGQFSHGQGRVQDTERLVDHLDKRSVTEAAGISLSPDGTIVRNVTRFKVCHTEATCIRGVRGGGETLPGADLLHKKGT